MGEIEDQVQKNLVGFCAYLEEHVEKWKSILQESQKTIEALCNQAEQLRHVEQVNLKDMEGFEETQKALQFSILSGIEEEISAVKEFIEKLSKANQNLKNKLTTLEKSSLSLNWEEDSPVVKGSATQPPLSRVLMDGLEFWTYFSKAFQNISEKFKCMDLRCEKSMSAFEKAFTVDLDVKCVTDLIALTQYVNNVNAIV